MPDLAAAGAAAGRAANAASLTAGGDWQSRLREAAYTSPKGTRIRFLYEDVSRAFDLRGTVFEFPGVDDAYVQRTGFGPRKYPLRVCFSGKQCDLEATAFEAALIEPGIGRLEHPIYGRVSVVPFGEVTRNDALKTAANQAIVEVTFWTSIPAIYPEAEAHQQSEILDALGSFNVAAAQDFARRMSLDSTAKRAAAKATIKSLLDKVSAGLTGLSDGVLSVNRAFRDVQATINQGLDVFIGQPLLLAQQVSNLIQLPGRALGGIRDRLDQYGAFADTIFGSPAGQPLERLGSSTTLLTRQQAIANDFHSADLMVASAVAASIVAATSQPVDASGTEVQGVQFKTRTEALEAAEILINQFNDWLAWREGGFSALNALQSVGEYQIDTGASYEALQQAVASAVGFLVQLSFSLRPEQSLVLDRQRTIIDLAAQLYRDVGDETLNLLIDTNNLTGSDILELQPGKRIVYYPPVAA